MKTFIAIASVLIFFAVASIALKILTNPIDKEAHRGEGSQVELVTEERDVLPNSQTDTANSTPISVDPYMHDERLDPSYKPKPEKIVTQLPTDSDAKPKPQLAQEALLPEAESPLRPEQVLPEMAQWWTEGAPNTPERQQALAQFVQSADAAVDELETTIVALQTMDMSLEKKRAYEALAREKIDAIKALKGRALAEDPQLLYVPIEP